MEMNMHVPQSISAATELRHLASVLRNIISPRTSSPIIQLFQDTMTGAYRITQSNVRVPEPIAMNILAKIRRPFGRKNREWTGAEIISAALPMLSFSRGGVTIKDGELESGVLKKGGSVGPLIHIVYNDMGPQRCGQLINDIQSIVTQFNLYTGFSVGTSDLIADPTTLQFVNEKIAEGRKRVSDILSDVHGGKYVNTKGLSDGEQLEDDISSAMKDVANKINEEVMKSLNKENRILQMVDSGSKGGAQNITQMVGLLAQQLIEGKRVQYTLQDRTLPHFARYDDGVESRGFVEHSFVDGLMPAEFFFHAQAGREGLIDTAVKTSDTGYIQRRLMKTMEDQHVEYDGTVRNVTGSIVQFHYGEDGMDTIYVEEQPCNLMFMTLENIYRDYALTPADVNPFLKEEVTETPDMVEELIADREMLFRNVFRHRKMDSLQAPVHLKRMIEKYKNPYSTKTDLTPDSVVSSLTRFMKEFPNNKVFHCLLRFYLAPKQSIVVHRLTQAMFDELMRDIRFRYIQAQVHAGEMVGALAAQSIGEPTTQLTLNSIAYHERIVCRKDGVVVELAIGDLVEKVIAAAKDTSLEHHPNNTTLAYMPSGEAWEALSVDEQGVVSWKKLEAVTKHPVVNEDGSNTLVKVQTKGGRTVMATKAKSFLSKAEDGSLQPTRGDELKLGTLVPIGRFENLLPSQPEGETLNHIVWDPIVTIEEVANPTDYVYDLTVADTRNFVHANGLCIRDTFHSAGTAKANATSGVPRIEELLSASSNPKRPSNTAYLNPEFSSQDETINKMKEIQRTTLRDITKSVRIFYDPYPLSTSTTLDEDRELLQAYEEFSLNADGSCDSPWILRLELDQLQVARRDVLDMTKIQGKLMSNPALKSIVECRHSLGTSKLVLRIKFDPAVMKNPLQLRFLEDKVLDTVLTGVDGIGRVHIRQVKNEVMYDDKIGGYSNKDQYVLDVEGTNLYDLMVFPGVDGTRVWSNDIHEINDVFGIEAARLSIYEEINEVFSSEKVNYRHLAVLIDSMTFSGRIVPVNRFGMSKNETGVLAKSSFEETSKIMFNAATWAEKDAMKGVSANIMFGQKPPCGTGFVDILVDESRLPEGPEDIDGENEEILDKLNQRLASMTIDGECRMEDILMEW